MQEESAEKFSIVQRIERLHTTKQLTWAELAELLGLSESMIYQVRRGKKQLSDKAIHRLEIAEGKIHTEQHLIAQDNTQPVGEALKEDVKSYQESKEPTLKDALQALGTALDVLKLLIEKEGNKTDEKK